MIPQKLSAKEAYPYQQKEVKYKTLPFALYVRNLFVVGTRFKQSNQNRDREKECFASKGDTDCVQARNEREATDDFYYFSTHRLFCTYVIGPWDCCLCHPPSYLPPSVRIRPYICASLKSLITQSVFLIWHVNAKSQISADSKQLFIFEYFPFQIFPQHYEFENESLLQYVLHS